MSAIDVSALNAQLRVLFTNGVGEAGLEVGADPGLSRDEYIRIPLRMAKRVALRRQVDGTNPREPGVAQSFDQLINSSNWVEMTNKAPITAGAATAVLAQAGSVYIHKGRYLWDGDEYVDIRVEGIDVDDIRAFVQVNQGHIKDAQFSAEQQQVIHSMRFWAVAGGLVTSNKSDEWMVVDNPPQISNANDDVVAFIASHSAQAFTSAVARTTSWRKTNHCTGGQEASGYPRRFLQKEGMWSNNTDPVVRTRDRKASTDLFYVGNHATSVHNVLALVLPSDDHHWAEMAPGFGIIGTWELLESTRVRMQPRDQVAGAALVTDSVKVLEMMVKEGIAPLLNYSGQASALATSLGTVRTHGMVIAVYSRWFFDGMTSPPNKVAFTQKDAAFVDLVGELATVAKEYYSGNSIADSAALSNAAAQFADDSVRQTWAMLGAAKRRARQAKVVHVVGLLKGAAASAIVDRMLDPDQAVATAGVADYNASNDRLARIIGITGAPTVNPTDFLASKAAAGAAAAPAAPAAPGA